MTFEREPEVLKKLDMLVLYPANKIYCWCWSFILHCTQNWEGQKTAQKAEELIFPHAKDIVDDSLTNLQPLSLSKDIRWRIQGKFWCFISGSWWNQKLSKCDESTHVGNL